MSILPPATIRFMPVQWFSSGSFSRTAFRQRLLKHSFFPGSRFRKFIQVIRFARLQAKRTRKSGRCLHMSLCYVCQVDIHSAWPARHTGMNPQPYLGYNIVFFSYIFSNIFSDLLICRTSKRTWVNLFTENVRAWSVVLCQKVSPDCWRYRCVDAVMRTKIEPGFRIHGRWFPLRFLPSPSRVGDLRTSFLPLELSSCRRPFTSFQPTEHRFAVSDAAATFALSGGAPCENELVTKKHPSIREGENWGSGFPDDPMSTTSDLLLSTRWAAVNSQEGIEILQWIAITLSRQQQ